MPITIRFYKSFLFSCVVVELSVQGELHHCFKEFEQFYGYVPYWRKFHGLNYWQTIEWSDGNGIIPNFKENKPAGIFSCVQSLDGLVLHVKILNGVGRKRKIYCPIIRFDFTATLNHAKTTERFANEYALLVWSCLKIFHKTIS